MWWALIGENLSSWMSSERAFLKFTNRQISSLKNWEKKCLDIRNDLKKYGAKSRPSSMLLPLFVILLFVNKLCLAVPGCDWRGDWQPAGCVRRRRDRRSGSGRFKELVEEKARRLEGARGSSPGSPTGNVIGYCFDIWCKLNIVGSYFINYVLADVRLYAKGRGGTSAVQKRTSCKQSCL